MRIASKALGVWKVNRAVETSGIDLEASLSSIGKEGCTERAVWSSYMVRGTQNVKVELATVKSFPVRNTL